MKRFFRFLKKNLTNPGFSISPCSLRNQKEKIPRRRAFWPNID